MPQIQTIEGLQDLHSLSQQRQPDVSASQAINQLPTVERIRIELPKIVDREKWLSAAKTIRKAMESNPNQTVLFPAVVSRSDVEVISENGQAVAFIMQGKKPTLGLIFSLPGLDRLTNVDEIRTASQADLNTVDKTELAMIYYIANQLDKTMLYVGLGLGAVAVLGVGWYMMKGRSPRRVSLRGRR